MIRYFYNQDGSIVGFTEYRTLCFVEQMCGVAAYIDVDQKVDYTQYTVDLTTQTLVAKSQ
jgi:hypothetical protein